jgi:HEPN domain-containing protein
MDEKVKYWIDLSEYDLDTAQSMLETGRYLYVGFMCHQAIEKIIKGYWQHVKNELPPKTHNLSLLLKNTGLRDFLPSDMSDFVDELEPLNIEARYPTYKDALVSKMNQKYTESILKKTRDLYSWIKQKL